MSSEIIIDLRVNQLKKTLLQDTRYKIFYFRYEAHSYNTIYIDLNNKLQY